MEVNLHLKQLRKDKNILLIDKSRKINQQCAFSKRYSTQHFPLNFAEKWKNSVDKGKSFGTLLTDLSKAFDIWIYSTCITINS